MVDHLIGELRKRFHNIADPRNGSNKQYPFVDIAMAAFSAFFIQSPSFLEHQRTFHQAHSKNACRSLFGIRKLPTDNHIREQLDRIDCQDVYSGFDIALEQMKKYQALKPFQILHGRSLLALDGSEFHNSYKIQCPQCRTRLRSSGETEYHHIVLCATLVGIGHSEVLPLRPQFITPQDGDQKQDCETKAAYRWFDQNAARYNEDKVAEAARWDGIWRRSLRPIYLGDDLYANQPMCEKVTQAGGDFIFRVKEGSHKTLFSYLDGVTWPTTRVVEKTPGRKNPNKIYQYRIARQLPIRDGNDALKVIITLNFKFAGSATVSRTQSFRFVTSLDVTQANAAEIVAAGRARWKIENEGFNLLKKHGYHMEHNFGHGKQGRSDTRMTLKGRSDTRMTLNLIAFAFHAVCNHLCQLWQDARARFSRKHRFFVALDIINCYLYFENWQALLSATATPQPRPPP